MYQSCLIYFLLILLFYCFLFLFSVTFSNDLFIPVPIENIKVKEEPAIPTGIPTTAAYEAMLKVPNDADKVINHCQNTLLFYLFYLVYTYLHMLIL